ncbi:AAA family ATPase [Burkholderia pyrrocinia]|uniref:AAA family ATPase n=1 Tax=Burkholderia pyrrocinia TaxID=60550 RepID=UPI00158BC1DD|nr:AAA family ATPase [Burkholderia pyrrocinia]
MLKSIEKIKGLGVYQSYSKPAGTQDFGIKNLIYGWNYSGKTTLSRLFAQLETKTANPDLSGCEFTLETADGSITEKNFSRCSLLVRVFNSDFVRANLHFDGGSFNPILLLGKDSEEAQRKIDQLSKRIQRSEEVQRKLDGKFEELKTRIAQAKTDTAKFIRQRLKVDPYTATHLGQDLVAVGVLESQLLTEKELVDAIELALTPDSKKPSTVEELHASPSIEGLHTEAVTVLAATPSFSNTIKHLEQNPAIERWVQGGLALHPSAGACEFCGNDLSQDRLEAFRAHFSKDLAEHKERVDGLLARVKSAVFSLSWPKAVELNAQFRESYTAAIEALPSAIDAFNQAIGKLADEVQRKADDSRKAMAPTPLAAGLEKGIKDAVAAVNRVIEQNNELASNFTKARADALSRARYHYVQQFKDDQTATGLELQTARLSKLSDRLKTYVHEAGASVDLGDGPLYANSFLSGKRAHGPLIATAPHHGADSNAMAYGHIAGFGSVSFWIRAGGKPHHPQSAYRAISGAIRTCTHCPHNDLPLRAVCITDKCEEFTDPQAWLTVRSHDCLC